MFAGYDDFILATSHDMQGLYLELPGADGTNKSVTQGPFVGIQNAYWSKTSDPAHAVVLSFLGGDHATVGKEFSHDGWAVRFGDSVRVGSPSPVPEPQTALLLGMGLLVLLWSRWRQGRRAFCATQAGRHTIA